MPSRGRCASVSGVSATTRGACLTLALLLLICPAEAKPGTAPAVPVPSVGNVTVSRLTFSPVAASGAARAPQVALANKGSVPAGAFVVATTVKDPKSGRSTVTVAVIHPNAETSPAPAAGAAPLRLRVPPGYKLVGPVRVAKDVLYANPAPPFSLSSGGTASVLAGETTPKLPVARIVRDAQLLALERSVPLADAGLLGLRYVAVQFAGALTTSLRATVGLAGLAQVNAVELRFPSGVTVSKASGPPGTTTILLGNAVQLVASEGFFHEGLGYSLALELSRAVKKGEFVTVRASTHYFESSLPFTERFALP